MRLSALPALLLLATFVVTGCGGDDGDSPAESASSSRKPQTTEEVRTECESSVELTGKVETSWSGAGYVITENQSGPVLYRTEDGRFRLTLMAGDDKFGAIASLTTPKGTFNSREGGVLEVDPDGAGADVDVDTDGGVHIEATLTC